MTRPVLVSMAVVLLGISCSQTNPSPLPVPPLSGEAASVLSSVPAWVTDPPEVPEGLRGQNNCTFPFGNPTLQWDFHPDGSCWERPGPDGWTRQHQYQVHGTAVNLCGGGPGDLNLIRVCREGGAGQPAPFCLGTTTTGPNGCALCVPTAVCH